ncbi:TPA: hypothetical protein I8624_005033 [Serratia marcescens]|nr:hypothetical protein [Serratia marcescens]
MLTTERQQFEEWIKFHSDEEECTNLLQRNSAGTNYLHPHTDLAWIAWQASREVLAKREAQPVAYIADCGTIVSESDPFFDEYKNPQPLYTAPPAPAYPERLPCPVHLLPGLKFGKGVPTRSMLDALKRREEYEAELDAMTPEQKSENDERLEKLKALIPLLEPAAEGELLEAIEEVIRISDRDHEAWDKAKAAVTACRAAILDEPKGI